MGDNHNETVIAQRRHRFSVRKTQKDTVILPRRRRAILTLRASFAGVRLGLRAAADFLLPFVPVAAAAPMASC